MVITAQYCRGIVVKGRTWVKRASLSSRGLQTFSNEKERDEALKIRLSTVHFQRMLMDLESPVEEFEVWFDMMVTERVMGHLVRHKELGKYVSTSRPDIRLKTEPAPKGYRYICIRINAKRFIEIYSKRTCEAAWVDTQDIMVMMGFEFIRLESAIRPFLLRPCERVGVCQKPTTSCGHDQTESCKEKHRDYVNFCIALRKNDVK